VSMLVRKSSKQRNETSIGPVLLACLGFGAAAMILVGIMDSQSRMGFFACLTSMAFVGLVGYGRGRTWRQNLTAIGLVSVAMVLAALFLASSSLVTRVVKTDTAERPAVWHDALGLIGSYPVLGCGLGGFESALVKYKTSNPTFDQDYA